MRFMNAYKYLDKLCREINGIGVTGYIDEMDRTYAGKYSIPGWESDCRKLKQYRYIRNQIAHDINANEANMTSEEDAEWLENFYNRIMNQTDPLAVRYKATQAATRETGAAASNNYTYYVNSTGKNSKKPFGMKFGDFAKLALTIGVILLPIALFFFVLWFLTH